MKTGELSLDGGACLCVYFVDICLTNTAKDILLQCIVLA